MKIALVYDRVNKFGGAERILLALHQIWPDAPLFTAVYNQKKAPWAKVFPEIIPSFLNSFPAAKSHHELYPLFTPIAFETFDFSDYDIVISTTSEAAKGIISKPSTLHISYILTPTRYLWTGYSLYKKNPGFGPLNNLASFFFSATAKYLQKWDIIASNRPDFLLAISQNVQKRILKYYHRPASVVYPPVDTDFFRPDPSKKDGNFFLIVSRLVPYKNIDIAIEAFRNINYPLTIIGTGTQEKFYRQNLSPNISMLAGLTDGQLLSYYQSCTALIFASDEDLGLVPIEAQSCGKPVIAYKRGGVLETVIEGKTGAFYDKNSPDDLKKAVESFQAYKYSEKDCRQNAQKFSKKRFKQEFQKKINEIYDNYQNQ